MKRTVNYVVTWFPADRPIRHVARRSLEDAHAYIAENDLMHMAPMIVEQITITDQTENIVWNSTSESRRKEPQ